MTDAATIAQSLTNAQCRAVLWCDPAGAPKDHEQGAPREVSFFCLSRVIIGDPAKVIARTYSLCVQGENPARKDGIWPMRTWRLTPLGRAVRMELEKEV